MKNKKQKQKQREREKSKQRECIGQEVWVLFGPKFILFCGWRSEKVKKLPVFILNGPDSLSLFFFIQCESKSPRFCFMEFSF